ncbi:MAG: MarP family serine protease [Micrococcus sp.]|nr:MarP family serine protease [Micrococcus sp.]
MFLGITWLDVVLVLILIFVLARGYRRGLWVVGGTLIGFIAGAIAAFYAVPFVAGWAAGTALRWAVIVVVAIALVAIGQSIGAAIGAWLRLHVNLPVLRTVDRWLGGLVSIVVVALVMGVLGLALNSLGVSSVTREINRSAVITGIHHVLPDGGQRWLSNSRAALAGLDALPELEVPIIGEAPTAAPTPEASTPADSQVEESVVRISGLATQCGQTQNGTGVVIAPDRVLTNAHVVAGVEVPTVETRSRQVHDGRVVYSDTRRDLAIVAVDGANLPVARTGASLADGEAAFALGYPAGGPFTVSPAQVQTRGEFLIADIYGGDAAALDIYQINAEILPGNSGGPLVTDDGDVAGLVFARAPGSSTLGYAISADVFAPLVAAAPGLTSSIPMDACVTEPAG